MTAAERAGAAPSVGRRNDTCDNAFAESIIGYFDEEVIHHVGPWRSFDKVEYAAPEWVAWLHTTRLLEPLGEVTPVEFEALQYGTASASAEAAAS